jgi:hypothetical protein
VYLAGWSVAFSVVLALGFGITIGLVLGKRLVSRMSTGPGARLIVDPEYEPQTKIEFSNLSASDVEVANRHALPNGSVSPSIPANGN